MRPSGDERLERFNCRVGSELLSTPNRIFAIAFAGGGSDRSNNVNKAVDVGGFCVGPNRRIISNKLFVRITPNQIVVEQRPVGYASITRRDCLGDFAFGFLSRRPRRRQRRRRRCELERVAEKFTLHFPRPFVFVPRTCSVRRNRSARPALAQTCRIRFDEREPESRRARGRDRRRSSRAIELSFPNRFPYFVSGRCKCRSELYTTRRRSVATRLTPRRPGDAQSVAEPNRRPALCL